MSRFISCWEGNGSAEIAFYRRQTSLEDAIEVAALSIYYASGKRHPHQTRLSQATLERCCAVLLAARHRLRCARSFDEVFQVVESEIQWIRGIGEMTVYDVAHRIGEYLELPPDSVYLHRGTREGARAIGLGRGRKKLEMNELPEAFQRLTPSAVEDCLCLYKDELAAIHRQTG